MIGADKVVGHIVCLSSLAVVASDIARLYFRKDISLHLSDHLSIEQATHEFNSVKVLEQKRISTVLHKLCEEAMHIH